jgi:multiple sugar transport system substrate-binding protein
VRNGKSTLRIVLLGMLTLVLAVLLAACGGGDEGDGGDDGGAAAPEQVQPPSEPTEIIFASWVGQEKVFKDAAKEFHELYPTITVKFQNTPAEEMQQRLTAQIAGGNPPDAAYLDASNVGAFASRGALVNLDDYIAQSDVIDPNDYVDAFKASTIYEDSMYGLPFDGESTGLFYRTDRFTEAGIEEPPTTWEEFEQTAAALTNPDEREYGFIQFAPESAYYWYPWLWQNGGDLYGEDGETIVFNSPEAKEAAEFYVDLTQYAPPDFLNSNSYDGRVAFANGSVAMYVAGAWFAGVMASEFPKTKGKWASAPLPEGEAGCATTIAGDDLVVFDDSDNQDAAWLWVEFLSRPENMANWTYISEESTLLPPRTSMLEDPEVVQKKPILEGFVEAMECGRANQIADPNWPEIEQALNTELGKAMYGDQTAAEALDKAAEEANEILED